MKGEASADTAPWVLRCLAPALPQKVLRASHRRWRGLEEDGLEDHVCGVQRGNHQAPMAPTAQGCQSPWWGAWVPHSVRVGGAREDLGQGSRLLAHLFAIGACLRLAGVRRRPRTSLSEDIPKLASGPPK